MKPSFWAITAHKECTQPVTQFERNVIYFELQLLRSCYCQDNIDINNARTFMQLLLGLTYQ